MRYSSKLCFIIAFTVSIFVSEIAAGETSVTELPKLTLPESIFVDPGNPSDIWQGTEIMTC